ncbi:PROX1 family protein [Megaselia abdita]
MMSSEEDTDSFGLYSSDNKSSLLIKTNLNKTLGLNNNQYNFKRNRQRVDAGEPRNTYATTTSVNSGSNNNNSNNITNNNSNCNNSNNNNLTAETVLTTLSNLMNSAGGAVAAQQSYGALNNNNNNLLSSTNTASDPLNINNNSSASPQLSLSPSGQLPTSTLSSTTTTSTSSPTLSSTTSSTSAAVAAAAQLVGGLFGPNGFGSAKMLNELFGRQMKQAQDATSGLPSATQQLDNSLLAAAIETATSNDLLNVNAINGSGKDSNTTNNTNTMSANTNGSATAQLVGGGPNSPILINNNNNTADQTNTELAHHMLRNILQGKKELLNSLDPEIRSVFNSASGNGGGILTPRTTPTGAVDSNNSENNNNNIINNNKNYTNGAGAGLNNLLNNCIEPMLTQIKSEPSLNSNNNNKIDNNGQTTTNPSSMQNGHHHNHQHHISDEQSDDEGKNNLDMKKESTDDLLDDEMMVALNSNGSDIESLGSPQSSQADELMKNELEAEIEKDSAMSSGQTSKSSEKIDLKRARVENIVSSMRSSPSSSVSNQNQVNGCKKRKLYQPQQHDQQTAMERYAAVAQAAAGLNFAGFNMQNLILNNHIDAEDESQSIQSPQLQQKRVEKNALESQLRSMKERLAEMEQQYVQLCSRLERESECHDLDDTSTGSLEQDMDIPSPSPPLQQQTMNENSSPNQQAQRPLNRHIAPLKDNKANQMLLENTPTQMLTQMMSKMMSNNQRHPHFNGAPHPLLQQFGGPHVPVPTDPSSHLPHPLSNALFLGQKFLLEQQAAAKEAAAEHERQAAAVQQEQQRQQQEHQRQLQQQQQEQHRQQQNAKKTEITDKFNMLRRNSPASSMSGNELEGLADILKSEILSSISSLVDTILSRYSHQRSLFNKQTDAVQAAAEQFNKDLQMAAHIVDRKSPRTKVACESRSSGKRSPAIQQANQTEPQNMREPTQQEQNEALSLVVQPKKKRHKVTDTRITPRTISRVLAQDGMGPGNNHDQHQPSTSFNKQNVMQQQHQMQPPNMNTTPAQSPSPRSSNTNNQQQQQNQQFHQQAPPPPPGSMLPVSLPTSVAIPNPSLHESQVFSPYSPFFNPHGPHGTHGGLHAPPNQFNHIKMSSSPPGLSGMMVGNGDSRDSPPLPHPPTMLHPALLAHAAHHGNSPDYSAHLRAAMDAQDRNSDCNSGDMQFDGIQPTISFLKRTMKQNDSLSSMHSSTLTPMHLRKAKLMFFWVRYPSSAVLKMYFPDIKFNKNNTAQLVKWFSNFREFYYIQMEKYARQANQDGVQSADDLQVTHDSELYRHLNLHYNRNNHIEVPQNFRFVVEQTLKEFFRSIQGGKDTEQSWKKSIYKIISRMDDPVPEYFKSPNFLEQLE